MSERMHTELVVGLSRRLASCHRVTKLMSHRRRTEKKVCCAAFFALFYMIYYSIWFQL